MGGKTGQVRFETSRNQLVGAVYPDGSSEEFAYDLVGNRTSLGAVSTNGTTNTTFYTYASGNRLVADASETATNAYAYDGAGRLTHHVVNGQTRTFTYDFQGRMTSLTDIDGSVFAYEFDGEGNRLSQSRNDCLSKRFVYDGADVLLELNPTNGIAYAWVNGPGIDQPIERLLFIDGTPRARRIFHADALGSIAALTDPSGLVTQTYAYAVFGSLRSFIGPDLNRVTYTAREQLGDSMEWRYYRHRIYNPSSGRFMSPDPLGFVDGPNLFAYVAGNPLSARDALGLELNNREYQSGIWYKPENGESIMCLRLGEKAVQDGFVDPTTGKMYKTDGRYVDDMVWQDWIKSTMKFFGIDYVGGDDIWFDSQGQKHRESCTTEEVGQEFIDKLHNQDSPDHTWDKLWEKAKETKRSLGEGKK